MSRSLLVTVIVSSVALTASAQDQRTADVVVNHVRLDPQTVRAYEQHYRIHIQDGRYWYDRVSGAWGFEGGPTVGFIPAGLDLGGTLRSDASRGNTGVFVNGRELHVRDVAALQQIVGIVNPGRYWLDAYGFVGYEGGPAFMNLAVMARQAGGGGGNAFYRSGSTDIGAGSAGGTSYVIGKDWSVTVDH